MTARGLFGQDLPGPRHPGWERLPGDRWWRAPGWVVDLVEVEGRLRWRVTDPASWVRTEYGTHRTRAAAMAAAEDCATWWTPPIPGLRC